MKRRSGLALGSLCALGAGLGPSVLHAQDGGLRLVFGIENRLELSRNEDLSVPATGTDLTNVTRLSFGLSSETAIDRLDFSVSGALVAENPPDSGTEFDFGRGAADLAYHREVPAAVLDLAASYRNDDVSAFTDEVMDFDETGARSEYRLSAALEFGRTSSIGFALGAGYEATDYQDASDPDLVDSDEARADAAVIFHASEVLTGRLGLRYSRRDEEDTGSTRTERLVTYAGLDYAISPRLDLSAEIGQVDVDTVEFGVTEETTGPDARISLTYDMPAGTALASLRVTSDADEGQRETFEIGRDIEMPATTISARLGITHADEAGTDVIGRLRVDRPLPDGLIGFNLERRVSYDDGPVTTSLLGVDWSQSVNELSSVSLDFSYEESDTLTERVEQVSVGAGYSRSLTADWTLDSGVNYLVRKDNDGTADSPGLFLSLSRDFELRP